MTSTSTYPTQDLELREAQASAAGDFWRRVAIDAPPAAVREAIGRPERWWTPHVERAGDQLTVSFGHGWTRFAVDELDWTVVAQQEPGLPEPDEWVGTTLSFRVYPGEHGGSVLSFVHRGLTEQLGCIEMCRAGWERHLSGGLKPLAEAIRERSDPRAARAIHQEALIDAPALEVYRYLTDGDTFAGATGMAARLDAREGSTFSLFDSRIEGRQIELVAGRRVVQAWRFGRAHPDVWEPGVYSIVRFTLSETGGETLLTIDHDALPAEWLDHIESGYPTFYQEPMIRYFTQHRAT